MTERLSRRVHLDIDQIRESAKAMNLVAHAKNPREKQKESGNQPNRQSQQQSSNRQQHHHRNPSHAFGIESSSSDDTITQYSRQQNLAGQDQQEQHLGPGMHYNPAMFGHGFPSSDEAFQGLGSVTDAEMEAAGQVYFLQLP